MKQKNVIAYARRIVIGLYCGVVGWAGGSGLIGFGLMQLGRSTGLDISFDNAFIISLLLGGVLCGFPLVLIGTDWASKRWPDASGK